MAELRIVFWNASGLKQRDQMFRLLLREQNIDLALINETHLPAAANINISGYHVLRLDATPEHNFRGLLVAIRR